MFARLTSFGLIAALVSATCALTLNTPDHAWVIGSQQTVTWESDATDPTTFPLLLLNTQLNGSVVLSTDTITSVRSFTLTVPEVSVSSDWELQAGGLHPGFRIWSATGPFSIEA